MKNKQILVLDFDGVLHSYTSGWQGAAIISDPPVAGAIEFCWEASRHFDLWIVSSRCSQDLGIGAIRDFLDKYGFPDTFTISSEKPPAYLTLDDRAMMFRGYWPSIQELKNFEPWYLEKESTSKRHEFFKKRLQELGVYDKNSDYAGMLGRCVEELSEVFAKQGHSGFSAVTVMGLFNVLFEEWDSQSFVEEIP